MPPISIKGDVKREVQEIKSYLYRHVEELKINLLNLEKKTRMPIGTVVLRETNADNGGFGYGVWEKMERADGLVYYIRKE